MLSNSRLVERDTKKNTLVKQLYQTIVLSLSLSLVEEQSERKTITLLPHDLFNNEYTTAIYNRHGQR